MQTYTTRSLLIVRLLVLGVAASLSLRSLVFGQTKGATKAAPKQNNPKQNNKGKAALAPEAPPAASRTPAAPRSLTMKAVEDLLKGRPTATAALNEFDRETADMLSGAAFGFELEESWVNQFAPAGQLSRISRVLLAKVPAGPTIEEAQQGAAGLLDQLRQVVASKKPNEDLKGLPGLTALLHPQALTNLNLVTEMFDTSRYQKHVLAAFREIPGTRRVGVPVYVLPNDAVEKFYFVMLAKSAGNLVIREVVGGPQIAELRLSLEKEQAVSKLKDLFRDLNQNSLATAQAIGTAKFNQDLDILGGWKRLTRGQRLAPEQIRITPSVPLDGKSVRVVAKVEYALPGGNMAYNVDFERFDSELKIVRVRALDGTDVAVDTDMDCEVLKRYGTTGPCEYKTNYNQTDVRFFSVARLKDFAQQAMEDLKLDDLNRYTTELESFVTDVDRADSQGLRATIEFMKGDFTRAYEVGSAAVAAGGEVFFPMAHLTTGGFLQFSATPVQNMRLGVSKSGIHYFPSYRSNQKEMTAPLKEVSTFRIDPGGRTSRQDPFLVVKVKLPDPEKPGKTKDQELHFFAAGSTCSPIGTQPPAGFILWTTTGPCPGSSTGGLGGLATGKSQPTAVTIVPQAWDRMLQTVVKIYETAKSPNASSQGSRAPVR